MMSLKQAQIYAQNLSNIHREPWQVFHVHRNAQSQQHPANIYNTGEFLAARAAERAEYEQGGAEFVGVCVMPMVSADIAAPVQLATQLNNPQQP